MKRIGILSDTHGYWDDRYSLYFSECDEIWHAGDIGDYAIVERLASPLCRVRAVKGNVDHGEVARKCRDIEVFDVEGLRVILTHIGGYPGKWAPGMKTLIAEQNADIVVDGHSHILKIMRDKATGVLNINPGAAGQQGWHRKRTLVRLTIDGSHIGECEVIELN